MEIEIQNRDGEIAVVALGYTILSLNHLGIDRWIGIYGLGKNGIQTKSDRIKEEQNEKV